MWGTLGDAPGQFDFPPGVAVDAAGHVYVTDANNDRIQKFTGNGTFLTAWGSAGSGLGELSFPIGIAVDGNGDVYVVDTGNERIQTFALA
jgi:DNA-binding beta-propeller fold protein YncE